MHTCGPLHSQPPPCQISESREEEQNQKTLLVQKAISKSLVGSTVDENVLLLGRPSCDCIRGAPETTTFSLTVSLCLSLVCLVFPDQSAVFSQIFFILWHLHFQLVYFLFNLFILRGETQLSRVTWQYQMFSSPPSLPLPRSTFSPNPDPPHLPSHPLPFSNNCSIFDIVIFSFSSFHSKFLKAVYFWKIIMRILRQSAWFCDKIAYAVLGHFWPFLDPEIEVWFCNYPPGLFSVHHPEELHCRLFTVFPFHWNYGKHVVVKVRFFLTKGWPLCRAGPNTLFCRKFFSNSTKITLYVTYTQ